MTELYKNAVHVFQNKRLFDDIFAKNRHFRELAEGTKEIAKIPIQPSWQAGGGRLVGPWHPNSI
jgi:hypothetical protein